MMDEHFWLEDYNDGKFGSMNDDGPTRKNLADMEEQIAAFDPRKERG